MVIAISLWLDQLCNGNIGRLGSTSIYKPLLIVTLIVSIFNVQWGLSVNHLFV